MPAPPITAEGYTARLAARHLLTGIVRPREAMREALAAGLGERGRLAVLCISMGLLVLADPATWSDDPGVVDAVLRFENPLARVVIAGIALVFLSGWAAMLYLVATGGAAAILSPGRRPGPLLAHARSAVAVGGWVSLLPIIGVTLVLAVVLPAQEASEPTSLSSILRCLVDIPYLALCLAEAVGAPPRPAWFAATAAIALSSLTSIGVSRAIEALPEPSDTRDAVYASASRF